MSVYITCISIKKQFIFYTLLRIFFQTLIDQADIKGKDQTSFVCVNFSF